MKKNILLLICIVFLLIIGVLFIKTEVKESKVCLDEKKIEINAGANDIYLYYPALLKS